MKECIFNKSIKDIAKALVKATDGNIKQTEALNILAKMDGFPSYNKEYRELANYEQNIKAVLQTKIDELQIDWEMLGRNKTPENKNEYILKIFKVIESFFVFKDNSKIQIELLEDELFPWESYTHRFRVIKCIIDSDLFKYLRTHRKSVLSSDFDTLSNDVYNSLKEFVFQEIPNFNKVNDIDLTNIHPSKVINWFKNFFDLKYSGYYDRDNQEKSFINNYLSNIEIEVNSNYLKQPIEAKEVSYSIKIDYVLKEHNIKIRLSYQLGMEYPTIQNIYSILFQENQIKIKDDISLLKDYVLKEICEGRVDLSAEISGDNNFFGLNLVHVEIQKIGDEFNMYRKKNLFLNPKATYNSCINELTKPILKKESFCKYCFVKEGILNNTDLQRLYIEGTEKDEEEENIIFKDISFSILKYVFETLNYELVHIMNNTFKKVFTDVIVDIRLRRKSIIEKLENSIFIANSLKRKDIHSAIECLEKALKENDCDLDISIKPIIEADNEDEEREIMILSDTVEFNELILCCKKKKEYFVFVMYKFEQVD